MQVIEAWHLKEPASLRRVLTCKVQLADDRVLLLSVWHSMAARRWQALVEYEASLEFVEYRDALSWEAAVAWCERTAQALELAS